MSKSLSIFWNVWINGKKLDLFRKQCIENIEIEERCDGSDTCTLTINDPDFIFLEDNIFIEEAVIEVNLGLQGDTHVVDFDGYISAIDIQFPENGCPVLSVYCLDESHVMNRKKKSRSWDNTSNDKVVRSIAKEYGFKCVIQPGYTYKVEDTISQSNSTDIEFCENLASNERELFMCKLIGDTLYYVRKGVMDEPSATLYYKQYPYDVISFSPKITKETRQEEIGSSDINTDDKSTDSAVIKDDGEVSTPSTNTGGYTYNPKTGEWERS